MSTYPIERIRREYAALDDVCYLNTGTVGIMSEPVLEKHLERIAAYERFGHFAEQDARASYERARRAFAALINADADEIALTRNASDGVNFVLAGLDLPDGATLLTTDQEHPAVLLPLTLAARRTGGSVEMIAIRDDDTEFLAALRRHFEQSNVHLAVISHASCETGKRLPIAEICRICKDYGVLILVDGAQSVGQFEVDVRQIGCDFMTGNGHKWVCGPKGTGFLYIRRDRIESLIPPYAGDGAVEPRFDRQSFMMNEINTGWGFRSDAQRFEFGTRNWHLFGGVWDAVEKLESIGWDAIWTHVARVSGRLKTELSHRTGVEVHTPAQWEDSCGIVTFTLEGWNGVELSSRLWKDFGIIQRRVQYPSGVRISCAHYTSNNDIDQFLAALDQLARQ